MSSEKQDKRPILTNRRVGQLVAVAVVLGLGAIFVADNFVLVEVRILTLEWQARLAWMLVVTFWLGVAAGGMVTWLWWRSRR